MWLHAQFRDIKTNRGANTPDLKRETRIWKTGTSGGRTWAESEAEWVALTGTCGAKNYVGWDKAIDAPALPGTDRDTFMFTIYVLPGEEMSVCLI